MITLRVWFDTKEKDEIMRIMHGIKSRVAYQLKDDEYLSSDCIISHFIAGKEDNRQEIDITDVKKDKDTPDEVVIWSDWELFIQTINVLRTHPHIKEVLIYDNRSENTANFIDWNSPKNVDGFRTIINPIN